MRFADFRCNVSLFSLVISGLSVPILQAQLALGLEGYYRFDGSGTDSSAMGRNLDLQGGVGFAGGLLGQALDLQHNDAQSASRPVNDTAFDWPSANFTVQLWANFYSLGHEQVLLEKFSGGGGPGWTLYLTGDSRMAFYANGTQYHSGPLSVTSGAWHHFLAREEGGTLSLYFDGGYVTGGSLGVITPSTNPLLVGKRNDGDTRDFPADARLDELALWSRSLSNTEIGILYNGGAGTPIPEPAGYAAMFALGLIGFTILRRRTS